MGQWVHWHASLRPSVEVCEVVCARVYGMKWCLGKSETEILRPALWVCWSPKMTWSLRSDSHPSSPDKTVRSLRHLELITPLLPHPSCMFGPQQTLPPPKYFGVLNLQRWLFLTSESVSVLTAGNLYVVSDSRLQHCEKVPPLKFHSSHRDAGTESPGGGGLRNRKKKSV